MIGTVTAGLRGFAAFAAGRLAASVTTLDYFGIVDPQIAPSDHFLQVWEHYGITEQGILRSVRGE